MGITHIVMWTDSNSADDSRQRLQALLAQHGLPPAPAQMNHYRVDTGAARIRWQLHTEFVSWTLTYPIDPSAFGYENLQTQCQRYFSLQRDQLPGLCLSQIDLLVTNTETLPQTWLMSDAFDETSLVGSHVAHEAAQVYTDFRLRADGTMRMLLVNQSLQPRRLGRLVQQLLEVETYRMMALLGLPAARTMASALSDAEKELASLAGSIRSAQTQDEAILLDRLTRLAGEVEEQYAATHSRFSATRAYFDLVDQRIQDIDETPFTGLQTLGEFIDRRLSPARKTCESAAQRQDALSVRVSRISHLLRTRVDFEQQQSAQDLLKTMNIRQDLQVRLQTTVEGLSVAAITYYITGLVSYIVKGAHFAGWPFSPEMTTACTVPVVAVVVWLFIHRLHHHVLSVSSSADAPRKSS